MMVWLLGALLLLAAAGGSGGMAFLLPTAASATTMVTRAVTWAPPSSVYVNLPFCRRRCFYCDFPIKVVGDRPGAAAAAARPYIDTVVREIRATAAATASGGTFDKKTFRASSESSRQGDGDGRSGSGVSGGQRRGGGVKTLFFGGGTPSLCPPELVGLLIETVRDCYGIDDGAEISIEMDPGTFDEARLEDFLALGITRVSMGVQSFDAGLLEACGRAHSLADVYQAVELLRKAKMDNFSIDLMSGLPKQTIEQWDHTLSEAVATGAAHISVYDLQVEAGTPFGRWFSPGEAPLPEDDTCADMYRTASRVLGRAGYDHYEISNYARPGFQSRHNRAYWENVPFLAFGNGAASFVDGHRYSRPRGLPEYEKWVDKLGEEGWANATGAPPSARPAAAGSPAGASEVSSRSGGIGKREEEALEQDALLDDVMLGFRLNEGLDLQVLASKYGDSAVRRVEEGVAEGLSRGWVVRESAGSGCGDGTADRGVVGASNDDAGGEKATRQSGWVGVVVDGSGNGSQDVGSALGVGISTRDVGDHDTSPGSVPTGDNDGSEGGGGERRRLAASVAIKTRSGLGRLRLSDPDGFLFSNSVISSVFCELDGWTRSGQEKAAGVVAPP